MSNFFRFCTLCFRCLVLIVPVLLNLSVHASEEEQYTLARERLIRVIEQDVRDTSSYINKTELDQRVMDAMASVPRHEFVPERQRDNAYDNRPLGIGHGQTISQPYMVAVMTDLIKPEPEHRVLEVGTGSGYQAAILAQLVDKVFTIEII